MEELAIEQLLKEAISMTARLIEDPINEKRLWTYQAVMLVESNSLLAGAYLRRLAAIGNERNPYSISVISYESIISCIPYRMCTHIIYYQANECLKYHTPIPTSLIALLVKDAILCIKIRFIASESYNKTCNAFDLPVTMENVVLVGFHDPYLLIELRRIKINLVSLVCVSPKGTIQPLSLSYQTRYKSGEDIVGSSDISSFWSMYSRVKSKNNHEMRDIADIDFRPSYFPHSSVTIADDQMSILAQLSELVQDINDCVSQFVMFNKAALVIKYDNLVADEKMFDEYLKFMNGIPGSITTMPLILNNIMKVVEKSLDQNVKVKNDDYSDEPNNEMMITRPIVVDHSNDAKISSIYADVNIESLTIRQLKCMPVINVWEQYPEPSESQKMLQNCHLNLIRMCYNNECVKTDSVKRFLHLLCCQKLFDLKSNGSEIRNPTRLNNPQYISSFKDNLRCNHSITPLRLNTDANINVAKTLEFPKLHKLHEGKLVPSHEDLPLFVNHSIEQLLCYDDETRSNFNDTKNILRGYNAFVKMTESVMVQTLEKAYQSATNILYKYFDLTDTIVLLFYNETDSLKRNLSDWRVVLPTPSGFDDFFFYLLSGVCPWIKIKEGDKNPSRKRRSRSLSGNQKSTNSPKAPKRNGTLSVRPKSAKNDEMIPKPAVLYDLKEVCIDLSGESTLFLSEDGTKVVVTRESFPTDSDSRLTIQTVLNNHTITFHKNLSQIECFEQLKFRISTADGVEFVFKDNKKYSDTVPSAFETHISLPSGLCIQPITTTTGPLYVKQLYYNESASPCLVELKDESYRCMSKSGAVLIFRKDGSVAVMRPGGKRLVCHKFLDTRSGTIPGSAPASGREKKKKRKRQVESARSLYGESSPRSSLPPAAAPFIQIVGYRKIDRRGVYREYLHGTEIRTIRTFDSRVGVDSFNDEIYISRMDGTNTLWKGNATMISSFPDGTVITSDVITEDELILVTFTAAEERGFDKKSKFYYPPFIVLSTVFKMEHPAYATITANSSINAFIVDMPNKYRLAVKANGKQTLYLDERTKVDIGGLEVIAKCTTCYGCASNTTVTISVPHLLSASQQPTVHHDTHSRQFPYQLDRESPFGRGRSSMAQRPRFSKVKKDREDYMLKIWDSCGKKFVLNAEGKMQVDGTMETTPTKTEEPKQNLCRNNCSRVNCMGANQARFFAMNRDFSGEEYFHEDEFRKWLSQKPQLWETQTQRVSKHETFMTYVQRLQPIADLQTKWQMTSANLSAKPKSLVRSDSRFFKAGLYNGSWMELWPGLLKERPRQRVNPVQKLPRLLSIRTFQIYKDINWEQLTINAARCFAEIARSDFRDFQKSPSLRRETKNADDGRSLPLKTEGQQNVNETEIPLSFIYAMNRKHRDELDQNYYLSILNAGLVIPSHLTSDVITHEVPFDPEEAQDFNFSSRVMMESRQMGYFKDVNFSDDVIKSV